MTARPRPRSPRARSHGRPLRIALLALAGLALFALGVGFGSALRENDVEPGRRTFVRTLKPLPLPPARRTVTVTVTR